MKRLNNCITYGKKIKLFAVILLLLMGRAQAATYTFNLTGNSFTNASYGWRKNADGTIVTSGFPNVDQLLVGWSGLLSYRSALDFNVGQLPQTEKVVKATLTMVAPSVSVQGLTPEIGSLVGLNPTTATPTSNNARFTWDSIQQGARIASLGPDVVLRDVNTTFDVTNFVGQNHLQAYTSSPFGLLENPARRQSRANARYISPILTVETAIPKIVDYTLQDLGNGHYRATYNLHNEISLPLGLLDIAFDPLLYREKSLSVMSGTLDPNWDAFILSSGVDVSPVVSIFTKGAGLSGGQSAQGFSVEFDWLGQGQPGSQAFTVYDPQTFQPLYSGQTFFVP